MTVKELKELLKDVDDNAVVLLYDGVDEGDVWCTDVVSVNRENYDGYCKGDSCVREADATPDKLFVLAGFGTGYNIQNNTNLHMFISGPEADACREAAEQKRLEDQREAEERRKEMQKKEITESRKRRYCINIYVNSWIYEANRDTLKEVVNLLQHYSGEYTVWDRIEHKRVDLQNIRNKLGKD